MAKAFRFRLEQLLDLRRSREEAAQRDLAEVRQAVLERNQVILQLMNREDAAKAELRAMQQRGVTVALLRMAGDYLAAVQRELQREYEALQRLVRAEIEKREQLTEARKGVRVLERLREKQERQHRVGLDLEERKFLDELGRRTA